MERVSTDSIVTTRTKSVLVTVNAGKMQVVVKEETIGAREISFVTRIGARTNGSEAFGTRRMFSFGKRTVKSWI